MGGNFGKAGLNLTAMNSTAWLVTLLRRVGSHNTSFILNNTSFILNMAMDEGGASGAPASLEALVVVPHEAPFEMQYTLQWVNKTSCHAPETIWLLSNPVASDARG